MFLQHALRRRRGRLAAALVVLAGVLAGLGMAPAASAASPGTPWPSSPNWQQYDETPTSVRFLLLSALA
jgi:hypothetical protein